MKSFHLRISSPEGDLFSSEVKGISLRGSEGDLAVMAGHVPFVTSVKPCVCKILLTDEEEKKAQLDGGLLTVTREEVLLLTGSLQFR